MPKHVPKVGHVTASMEPSNFHMTNTITEKSPSTDLIILLAKSAARVNALIAGGLIGLLGVIIGGLLVWLVLWRVPPQPSPPLPAATSVASEPSLSNENILKGARMFNLRGQANAPVTLVLFSDLNCPFCKQIAQEVLPSLIQEFVNSGQVSLTYRHLPILGNDSIRLATALECAGQQRTSAFWGLHDHIYLSPPETSFEDAALGRWVEAAGLNASTFGDCLMSPITRKEVENDLAVGRALNIAGTPTLFINGKRLVGAVPYTMLKESILSALRDVTKAKS